MAAQQEQSTAIDSSSSVEDYKDIFPSYLGVSFAIFLGFLPKCSISYVSNLQSHNRALSLKLFQAEEQLKEMYSRRKEDSKANARVVEIFASHRHGWQQEEKRLLHQVDAGEEEVARLRGKVEKLEKLEDELKEKVEELKREVSKRDEMLNFASKRREEDVFEDTGGGGGGGGEGYGGRGEEYYGEVGSRFERVRVSDEGNVDVGSMEECNNHHNVDDLVGLYGRNDGFNSEFSNCASKNNGFDSEFSKFASRNNGFNSEFSNSNSKFWAERSRLWQDIQYEASAESVYDMKHYVARRESPWKVDGDSSRVSSKLKLLENELLNLERIGTTDPKVPSLMTKQAKRYQALAGKIDDLRTRMQERDPGERNLSPEFRTQRETEFLLEAFRLKQRASETAQKLTELQTETWKGYFGDDLEESHAKLAKMRSVFTLRTNFREIQRNLEIWLARIIGELEGILVRDGTSLVKDYYVSRYPFIQ